MIIAHNEYNAQPDIDVSIYRTTYTNEPFIVRVSDGTSIHLSHEDASLLHTQLMAALYEYEGGK